MRTGGTPARRSTCLRVARAALGAAVVGLSGLSVPAGATTEAPHAASPVVAGAPARLRDVVVFTVKAERSGKSAAERARAATEALERAAESHAGGAARVERRGDVFVVLAGGSPVIELGEEDASASGFASAETLAASVADRVRSATVAEERRSSVASAVFSFSLVVFSGLVSSWIVGRLKALLDVIRRRLDEEPERFRGLTLDDQEVIGAPALRGAAMVTLALARFVAMAGVGYLWLVFSLSLFATTRPYTERLTGLVVTPLSALVGRVAASLPLALVAVVSGVALYVLLRFVQLYFEAVEAGRTTLGWLPAHLASATSGLLRAGIVVAAVVFAAPVVTGDPEGALARAGTIALVVLGLSGTPLLASLAVGVVVVYGGRFRVGDRAAVGEHHGVVVSVGLLEVILREPAGTTVRVPHLLALVRPTRALGPATRLTVALSVAPGVDPRAARDAILGAVSGFGADATVDVTDADAAGSRFRVAVTDAGGRGEGELRLALVDALASLTRSSP